MLRIPLEVPTKKNLFKNNYQGYVLVQNKKKRCSNGIKSHEKTAVKDVFLVSCQAQWAWQLTEKISFTAAFS